MPPEIVLIGNDLHGPLCEMGARYADAIVRGLGSEHVQTFSIQTHQPIQSGHSAKVILFRGTGFGRGLQLLQLVWQLLHFKEPKVLHLIGNGNPGLRRTLRWIARIKGAELVLSPFGILDVLLPAKGVQLLCLSDAQCARYAKRFPELQLHLVPNLGAPTASPVRKEYNRRLLFCSVPVKAEEFAERGILFLLEAAKAFEGEFEITILNRYSWLETALEKLISDQGITNVTIETRFVSSIVEYLKDFSAILVPYQASHLAQVPQSAVEGLACGLPCLVSGKVSLSDLVKQHHAGLSFSDLPSFAVALRGLEANYSELSAGALHLAESKFSPEQSLKALSAVYRKLNCRTPRPISNAQ